MIYKKLITLNFILSFLVNISTAQKQNNTLALFLNDSLLSNAHVGICIYEPSTKKYIYNYQNNKYFIPASNTKIFTCYAALKYLGDSLVGLKYKEYEDVMVIQPTGDPTLLHSDFKTQPVFDFLKNMKKLIFASDTSFKENALGKGWAWDDYNEEYMPERSALPIYGNLIHFTGTVDAPEYYPNSLIDSTHKLIINQYSKGFIKKGQRDYREQKFNLIGNGEERKKIEIPFITSARLGFSLLSDTLGKDILFPSFPISKIFKNDAKLKPILKNIYSQPTDSMLKLMMYKSDNFLAEQALLMVSNEKLGIMNDAQIIDTLLKYDLNDLLQKPKWVDGCGLSRYNLFTPENFVQLLNKMKNEIAWKRITAIFPTGNEGSLKGYYQKYAGNIFAKTGSMSNVVALSGFIKTKSGNDLIFSVIVNNHQADATKIRRLIEHFISEIIDSYK